MNRSEIIQDICKKHNVALIYIFGSRVSDGLKILNDEKVIVNDRLTDIDIGIVFKDDVLTIERYLIYSAIYNSFADIFAPLELDLTFLEENHSVLQSQAILGECIYIFNNDYKDRYEHNVLARAADFKFVLDKYYEEKMEKIV